MNFRTTVTLLIILIIAYPVISQHTSGKYDLLFITEAFEPEESFSGTTEFELLSHEIINGKYYRIIQFYEIPTIEKKEKLKNLGIEFLDYIPNRAYLTFIPETLDLLKLKDFDVRSILPVPSNAKVHPLLASSPFPAYTVVSPGILELNILFYRNSDMGKAFQDLRLIAAEILNVDYFTKVITAHIHEEDLSDLTSISQVYFIEPADPPAERENYTSIHIARSNYINTSVPGGLQFDGSGINIQLNDDGVIGPHIDFQGRVPEQFTNWNNGTHGDHIAGTMVGGGNLNPKNTGLAPGADVYVYRQSNYRGFDSILTHHYIYDITLTSTSYGNGCNAGYTSFARRVDQQINDMPSLMHVFSAGNSGNSDCGYGAGNGWGNITGGNKSAKNVLAVGNVNLADNIAASSSRGPATDGRIKPDITAKGTSVMSTIDYHTYASKTGTSMSAPEITASLAQLYQAYKELNNGENPPSALIKGIILNTADDLGNPGPDFIYGWGRINNRKALKVLENQSYLSSTITHGNVNTHSIAVPANTRQINVMVYWADHEALANASVALVNDINMTITSPENHTFLPWVLNPFPDSVSLPATTGIDNLNNMEQITIDHPLEGNYQIDIHGYNIPFGPQTYYLIYEFITDQPVITFPAAGQSLVPGEVERILWDAVEGTLPFHLEYSVDNGDSWQTIQENINPNQRHRLWMTPYISGEMILRISRGNEQYTTGPVSIVRVPENLVIASACQDFFTISWDSVPGASIYQVTMLGERKMEPIGITSGLSFPIRKHAFVENHWVAVQAIAKDGATGRRTIAMQVSYSPSDSNNILHVSYENNAPDSAFFEMDTLSGLAIAGFQYVIDGPEILFENLSEFATGFIWNFGDNTYSSEFNPTKVYSQNGEYTIELIAFNQCSIDTMRVSVEIIGANVNENKQIPSFSIYPNPASGKFTISLKNKMTEDLTLIISNIQGQQVFMQNFQEHTSSTTVYQIDLSDLPKGIYVVSLINKDQKMIRKLILQ